jgi:hypothetical protein
MSIHNSATFFKNESIKRSNKFAQAKSPLANEALAIICSNKLENTKYAIAKSLINSNEVIDILEKKNELEREGYFANENKLGTVFKGHDELVKTLFEEQKAVAIFRSIFDKDSIDQLSKSDLDFIRQSANNLIQNFSENYLQTPGDYLLRSLTI